MAAKHSGLTRVHSLHSSRTQVVNAVMLPLVLGFLFLLSTCALPKEYALRGWHKFIVGSVFSVACIASILAVIVGAQA